MSVHEQQQQSEHLKRISQSLLNLPTLPTVAARLLDLVDHPKTNAATLARFVAQDQVITARLLKMCNSAYFGLGREVTSVHQAVVFLGFDMVKEISLGVSVINAFRGTRGIRGFDITGFWDHSYGVGLVARRLAKKWRPALASEAFTAGLLHDIGKVILIQYMPEDFMEILQQARAENRELCEVEEEHLGTHHGQIGAWLAERWKLPHTLCETMLYHHDYAQASQESRDLVILVQFADVLTRMLKVGYGGNPVDPVIPDSLTLGLKMWGVEIDQDALDLLVNDLAVDLDAGSSLKEDFSS